MAFDPIKSKGITGLIKSPHVRTHFFCERRTIRERYIKKDIHVQDYKLTKTCQLTMMKETYFQQLGYTSIQNLLIFKRRHITLLCF